MVKVLVLKREIKVAIMKNNKLKADLADSNDVLTGTIDDWRRADHPMLTTATNLAIIRKYLELDEHVEILEPKDDKKEVDQKAVSTHNT